MKTLLLTVLAAAGFAFAAAPSAQAGDYYYGSSHRSYNHCAPKVRHCEPTYRETYCEPKLVCTEIVCKERECRTGYDHCGRQFTYHVTVITYKDVYSNGHSRTYTKTLRA